MVSFLKKHRVILTSLALCILSLQIASTNTKGIGGNVIAIKLISAITSPIQYTVTSTLGGIKTVWMSYFYLVNVSKENVLLKNDIAILMEENNQLKETVFLNKRLKELLEFKQSISASAVAADVIGIENTGWIKTATINKGASHGIKRDMAVVTPNGIVGRIIDVQPTTSKILLVIDPRCNIDVIAQRSRIKGIAEGNGTDKLILKYVNHSDDIQIGDILISSGLGGIFPKGLVIGEVVRVEKGDDNFFIYIEVKPGAELRKLEEVLIITENKSPISPLL